MTLPYFLQLATDVHENSENELVGYCVAKNQEDLDRLEECRTLTGQYDLTFEGDIAIDVPISFKFSPYIDYGYAGYKDFFENAKWWTDVYATSPSNTTGKIFLHCWQESVGQPPCVASKAVQLVCLFANRLCASMYTHDSTIVFFGQKAIDVSLKIDNSEEFFNQLKNLNNDDIRKLEEFSTWLTDDSDKHFSEKRAIVALSFSEILSEHQKYTFLDVIINSNDIFKKIDGQYKLYLENFSYDKFIKKLEEKNQEFISKTNETLNKVLAQTLALPIFAAALSAFRIDSIVAYAALFLACLICALALRNQFKVLDYIDDEVDGVEKKGRVPDTLENEWKENKNKIKGLINGQRWLGRLLFSTILICGVFAATKLVFDTPNDEKGSTNTQPTTLPPPVQTYPLNNLAGNNTLRANTHNQTPRTGAY